MSKKAADNIRENSEIFTNKLRLGKSFDIVKRDICICKKPAFMLFVDWFMKDEISEKLMEFFFKVDDSALLSDADTFASNCVPYVEVTTEDDVDKLTTQMLSGALILYIDGFEKCISIDLRTYPQREISELYLVYVTSCFSFAYAVIKYNSEVFHMLSSFFLGANSGHGFYSLYKELIDLKKAKAVYILKGGPGSGKSSLMKKVAKKAESLGYAVERIYCSSDPDSLDGIIIPALSTAIVDGTAPHVVEPVYPIAVERYVNLGQFADYDRISEKKDEIIRIKEKYSGYFQHVYRLTTCAERLDNELFDIALGGISVEKLHAKAKGIISREISGKGICKNTRHRFASAISPKGYVHLPYESADEYSHIYVIEDSFGLGHFIFTKIINACENNRFECTVCHNPLKPEKIEHLIIPELSLAFITSNKENPYTAAYYRKLRIDNMIDNEVLKNNKQRLTLLRKTRNSLIKDACEILRQAKLTHDELEDIYNPHINFDKLYAYADELAAEIIG